MPATPHVESHFTASASVRDVVIGMADGLTVPFALAAGVSGAVAATAPCRPSSSLPPASPKSRPAPSPWAWADTWPRKPTPNTTLPSATARFRETIELPDVETEEVAKVFREYGLSKTQMAPVVNAICGDQNSWVDFMMRFELGLEEPDPAQGQSQRHHHRRVVHLRGTDPPRALHDLARRSYRPALFRGDHACWRSRSSAR